MTSPHPSHVEHGAQLVGILLKSWPAKEAPLSTHIVFCEELQRVVAPLAAGEGQEVKWFGQLQRELNSRLVVLRRLADNLANETNRTRQVLHTLSQRVPADLRPILRRAMQ